MVSRTDSSIIMPLRADVTTTNIQDNQLYPTLVSNLPETIKKMRYMTADLGYDGQILYDLSMDRGFQLVYPTRRYRNTPQERINLIDFY